MELTSRQRKFIKAAYKASPSKRDSFVVQTVGESLGYGIEEALDVSRILERDFGYLHRIPDVEPPDAYGARNVKEDQRGMKATLTDTGREAARQMRDDAKAKRWEAVRKGLKWFWGLLITAAVSVSIPWFNRRMERVERQQQNAPTSQPASPKP